MWWLGSLPWAYWPISPEMSGEVSPPSTTELTVKSESSFSIIFSLLPKQASNPATSCGASHVYCQALPSQ